MKKILLLGTGGTIACVPSAYGLVPQLDGAALLQLVPQLDGLCRIDCKQIMNLDSSNLEPRHWQQMAEAVAHNYDAYDGIVITHGTDTMAYSAAALSQMLQNCRKPVIFTGAQLPMQAAGSDAHANVLHAFTAACSDVQGVCLAFGRLLIHGSCAKKLYTQSFDGFGSVNRQPLAIFANDVLLWQTQQRRGGGWGSGAFSVNTKLETKVAVVKILPGTTPDILDFYLQQGYKGLIIEGFGAGGVPNGSNNWLPQLQKALQAGVKIICATQCLYDGVHLDTYPIGVLAQRLGAQSAGYATIEAAAVKLMWELGQE
ncbi:asparaginase [uncultured Phascolarctobacterium sp.]|uniref:asparaginase n=1 Tax=uncultured Phascolarctobacterium sp. TaxID=512296 RepID=UPI0025DEFFEB|nr:asparaginase [uncultured Phascolarctobacterium sp.]